MTAELKEFPAPQVVPMQPTENLDEARIEVWETQRRSQWDRSAPYIVQALAHCGGSHSIEDVFACYLRGSVLLWAGERCAAITEFHNHPRKRVLNVWLAGGDLTEMQELRAGMAAWARGQGCTDIQFMGRPTRAARNVPNGWAKASGFEAAWVTMTGKLADER